MVSSAPPPTSLLVLGPALVDHVQGPEAAPVSARPGGNGLIFAGTAALLGAHVRFAGQRGDDEAGRSLRNHLAGLGVDVGGFLPLPGVPTKRADIVLDESGAWRTAGTAPARFPYLPPPALPAGIARVQIMGLTSLLRACPDRLAAWIAAVREAGLPLGVGLNRLDAAEGPAVDALLGPADAVFCNAAEWHAWRGTPADPERGLEGGPGGDLHVSLGAGGVLARSAGGRCFHRPAPRVRARCTLGAGDVLCAAIVLLRAAGLDLPEAVEEAQALAAGRVRHPGWDDWAARDPALLARLRARISPPG
ncbi:MAG: carbohydrate kinase family protein [Pseudomonadota bacterium]